MIVEDEKLLLGNIAHNIPWEENGIEVVATAANGLEALQLFEQTKPELLLLDIQMPEIDGLMLAREAISRSPRVKIVILSGYDDFKYAQEAIELNVVKYLLKPAGDREILDAVLEARELARAEMEMLYSQEVLQNKWKEHLPQLQEAFLQKWVAGRYAAWEIDKRSRELMIDLSDVRCYVVAVVAPDPLTETETRFSERDSSVLQFVLTGIAKEYLEAAPCSVFADYEGQTVLLFMDRGGKPENSFVAEAHLYTERLLNVVKECLKITASAGIGRWTADKEGIAKSYVQACKALQERVVYGHHIAIPYREQEEQAAVVPTDARLEKMLALALETGNEGQALEAIDALLALGMDRARTVEEVRENVLFFSSLIVRMIQSRGWSVKEVIGDQFVYFQNVQALHTKEQIVQWLHSAVSRVTGYANARKSTSNHELVTAMLSMVEEEIGRDISLHTVAQKLYVNPSYLSRLFKQETGQLFSAYVLERKMNLAMERLHAGAKVYDTAKSLGYRDVSYFTKVFRKHWGITPGEVKAQKSNVHNAT